MSVTAVPLSTISSASKAKLFAGLAALVLAGGVLAYAGTEKLVKASLPASAFLEKNAEAEGVQVTSCALQYKVRGEGAVPWPTARDLVQVHYDGRLPDGLVFDYSYQLRPTAAYPLRGRIPGWTAGTHLIPSGP